MSETYRLLLREVVQHPDDDEARLAFAAHVRGSDPDLARFIQLQVDAGAQRRRARRGRSSGPPTLDGALLKQHGARWAQTIAKYTARHELDRGFIAEVAIEPNVFLEHGAWLLDNAPIRYVLLGASKAGPFPLAELLDSPLLERLDAISFGNQRLTDDDVARIAASPHLGRLLCMDLSHNPLTLRGFEALAAAPDTRKLLVIGRQQSGRQGTYFPGPVYAATGEDDERENPIWDWTPMPEEGKALERAHGYIPWLHPQDNHSDWLDARYHVDRGTLPVRPPGSPVTG